MSNEVKKEKGSLMNSFLKSSVGKLAILAGAAMSMSSCTTTTYSNATGYWERVENEGVSANQVLDAAAIVGGIITDNRAINKGGHVYHSTGHGHGGKSNKTVHCHGQVYYSVEEECRRR